MTGRRGFFDRYSRLRYGHGITFEEVIGDDKFKANYFRPIGKPDHRGGGLGRARRSKTANGVGEDFLNPKSWTGHFAGFLHAGCDRGKDRRILHGSANEGGRAV